MKTILVATDFSIGAKNATDFAAQLATENNSRIILLHVFAIPIMASEGQVVMYSIEELEEIYSTRIKEETTLIKEKYNLNVEAVSLAGWATDEIIHQAQERKADLIVMGIQGGSTLGEIIVGSTTVAVSRKSNIPLLIVPSDARFQPSKTIALASDLKEVGEELNYSILKDMAKMYQSKVYIVNVKPKKELVSVKEASTGIKIDHFLEGIDHDFYFMEDEDFEHGMDLFLRKINANLLVMVPHRHNFLSRIINQPHTAKMIFHTDIPILCLPILPAKSN